MNVVIVGCGRVGAAVAEALNDAHRVTIIDWNSDSFSRLPSRYHGETIVGNGIDVDVLHRADVQHADVFLALTDGDNRNLMAAQVATQLGAKKSVARVYDAERSHIFSSMGQVTFSPTVAGAQRLFDLTTAETEG